MAAVCGNRVLFSERALDRFSASSLVSVWQDWSVEEMAFTDDCYDASPARIGVRLTDTNNPKTQVLFFVRVDAKGRVPEREVANLLTFAARGSDILTTATGTTRVHEFVQKGAVSYRTLIINATFGEGQLSQPVGSTFSGIVYTSEALSLQDELKLPNAYLVYEIEKGSVWYRLPLTLTFSAFPEAQTVVKHYSEAARSVSKQCVLRFSQEDTVSGVVGAFVSSWQYRVQSTLANCPPRFEEVLSSAARATVPTQDLKTLTFQTPTYAPSFLQPFPYGIMTTLSFGALVFRHLRNLLAFLIMVAGVLGFFVVIWQAVVYPVGASRLPQKKDGDDSQKSSHVS